MYSYRLVEVETIITLQCLALTFRELESLRRTVNLVAILDSKKKRQAIDLYCDFSWRLFILVLHKML